MSIHPSFSWLALARTIFTDIRLGFIPHLTLGDAAAHATHHCWRDAPKVLRKPSLPHAMSLERSSARNLVKFLLCLKRVLSLLVSARDMVSDLPLLNL